MKKKLNLQDILRRNFHDRFHFLLIGANDGVSFDTLWDFINSIPFVSGLAVEPVRKYYDQLCENLNDFPNVKTAKYAIHKDKQLVPIFKVKEEVLNDYPDWVRGINSIFENHHLAVDIPKKDIHIEYSKACTMQYLLEESKTELFFDLIQIDTEGYDDEIIKMIDFSKVSCKIIKYEHCNLSRTSQKDIKNLLRKEGFSVFTEGNDTVGIDLKKIDL